MKITNYIKNKIVDIKWKIKNRDNMTYPGTIFSMKTITVGQGTYGTINVNACSDKYNISIGNYCSIAPNVQFILNSDHNLKNISTYPFKVKMLHEEYEAISKGNIVISDDVWIGENAIVLSGVHIGQGAVVAAGAVVTKDVNPYTIVGGIPAHFIKKRFSDDMIEKMMKIDYSLFDSDFIKNHIDVLYTEVTNESVDKLLLLLSNKHQSK